VLLSAIRGYSGKLVKMAAATSRGALIPVAAALVLLFTFTTFLTSTYRSARRSRAQARYERGVELANKGKNDEASEEFRAALAFAHNDSQYRLALVRSLMARERWSEAESHLSELRALDPTNGLINLMLARLAARDGRTTEAVTLYQRAIYGYWPEQADQNRIEARFELVDLLRRAHQQQQAVAQLLELAAEIPDTDTASHDKVGRLLLANGSPQHAAEAFRSAVAAQPNDAAALEGLGEAEFALRDYPAARNAFRGAARNGAGSVDLARRIDVCNSILDLDPTLVRLSSAERYERAQELVRRTVESLRQCSTVPPALDESVQKAIGGKHPRRHEGDTVELIALAQQAWKVRQDTCPAQSKPDEALAAVMARIQTQ
jgi:tetratricopeptide (TPR) repeat protein